MFHLGPDTNILKTKTNWWERVKLVVKTFFGFCHDGINYFLVDVEPLR